MKVQRLRVTFARDEEQKYITHLDLMRAWERVLERARVPVALSEGFSPRPRIALAAPLAVGVTSDCEVLDVFLSERMPLAQFIVDIQAQLPNGIRLIDVTETPLGMPSLQSLLQAAVYVVEVTDPRPIEQLQRALDEVLARDELPWEHRRGDDVRRYDLRALIFDIRVCRSPQGTAQLTMRLRADEQGSGRPEQVTAALGITERPLRIHRSRLEIQQPSLALAAHRAAGRLAD